VLNNFIYGMTGGQSSPTTPEGAYSHTSPMGQLESPFDIVELTKAAGAGGVSRGTVFHVKALDGLIAAALTRPGFNLVEALTPCFTQYGRGNGFKNPVEMFRWLKDRAVSLEAYEKLADKAGKIPIGTFVERGTAGLETRYAALCRELREKKGGAA